MLGIVIFLLLIVFIAAFLVISERIFERTNFYLRFYGEKARLRGNEKVDYVNTGSTFAYYGMDYEAAGVKGLNLALCPQTLEYDFKMLKHYANRYKPGAKVFIIISDLAFAKERYTETRITDKYYRVLDKAEISDYRPTKSLYAKHFPVLYSWKNFLRFHWDIKPDNEYECKVNENDQEAVEADALKRCKAWMEEFGLHDLADASQKKAFESVFSFTTNTVINMISWCRTEKLQPVLVNLPMASEMTCCFSKAFLNAFYYDQIDRIVKATGVTFLDMNENKKLTDYLLYLDSCRLNKAGRAIISKLLVDKVSA